LEGGTSTNLCDWDTPNGGVVGINLTKGITPVLSLEFQLQAGIDDAKNWNWTVMSLTPNNTISNASFMANTKINLMNWFGGYKGAPRTFEIQARGGFGYMRHFFVGKNDQNRCNFKFGFDFDWNLGKEKAWTISLRPAVILKTARDNDPSGVEHKDWTGTGFIRTGCDNSATEYGYLHNCLGQITAGVTYHFKTSNGTRHFAVVKPEKVTEYVEKIVEKPVEKVVEKVVEKAAAAATITGAVTIEFAQNKATLTNTAKAKLNAIDKSTTVNIDGYASPEGSKSYNQKLSQRRCDAVKAYLVERGVKVAGVNAHGAEGPESQRVVYVTVK
jgi:outer membrane protein OmpA-like peptidoglycan-associated protein